MIDPAHSIKLINSIEKQFPVDEWRIDGVHVWPLIRINENWNLVNITCNSKQIRKRFHNLSQQLQMGERLIKAQANFIRAFLSDRKNNQCRKNFYPVVFGADVISRNLLIYGRWYHILCDPFIDYFESKNIPVCTLEFSAHGRYKTPRYRPSIYLQPQVDKIRIITKFSTASKSECVLPGYKQILQLIKQEKLQFLIPDIDSLKYKVKLLIAYRDLYLSIFTKLRPQIGFYICYYSILGMAFNLACRTFGIPSFDIQHGVQGQYHSAYSSWQNVPQNGYELLPSYFWCWAEDDYEDIKKWSKRTNSCHQPIIGGNLFIKKWFKEEEIFQKYKLFANKLINSENINVLITHQGIPLPDWFIKTIEKSDSKIKWLLRLHPGTDMTAYSGSDIPKLSRLKNVEISKATTIPVLALLEMMSIHVTQWSSTVLEAKAMGVHTIIIHEYGNIFYANEIKKGLISVAFSGERFNNLLESKTTPCKSDKSMTINNDISDRAFDRVLDKIKLC